MRRPALPGVLTGLVLLAGCAVGGAAPEASPEPRADLARQAEIAVRNQTDAARDTARSATRGPDRVADRSQGRRAGHGPAGAVGTGSAAAPRMASSTAGSARADGSWSELVSFDDPAGDQGNGPRYADLTSIDFRENDGMLAATVMLGSVVPGRLADREVEGVGIDVYRSSSEESDYQVFLDGGRPGWRAFLQTPQGFVKFPGTFSLSGRTLRVVLPWESIGGRDNAQVSLFVDWSSGVGRLATDGTKRAELVVEE